tara:strand:+ start:1084 stop:1554 length:471 start_codon:yes stop_codon:yes gene_type:complete
MTGKKMIDLILLGLSLLATLAALGVIVYKEIIFKRPLPNSEIEKAKLLASGQTFKPINSYKMKRVIVNLPSRSKKLRFLEITTEIVPFNDDQVAEIEKNKHIVRDAFLDIAGEMSPEELNSLTGKILLENRIKTRLNKEMGTKIIQELYFTKFVVQ